MASDAHKLLSHLPPDTAATVLDWLQSRGKDLPVHIPLKAIKFARECFNMIDTDKSGTLEPSELLAVFKALGQPVSLRQVMRLVESVAGAGVQSLRFSDFAQMMHGAMTADQRRGEREMHSILQEEVNLGGKSGHARGNSGGRGGAEEPPLNWSDFHLLAKAFRRRVVLDGVISGQQGWRARVMALAEKRQVNSRANVVTAASVWKHRTKQLAPPQGQDCAGAGNAGVKDEGGAQKQGEATQSKAAVNRDESDALQGAISAGPTPRSLDSCIRVDREEVERNTSNWGQPATGAGTKAGYQDIFKVFLEGPASQQLQATAGGASSQEAAADSQTPSAIKDRHGGVYCGPRTLAFGGITGKAGPFDWRRSAARMRAAGAAGMAAVDGGTPASCTAPACAPGRTVMLPSISASSPRQLILSSDSRLLVQTISSRTHERTGKAAAVSRQIGRASCKGVLATQRQLRWRAGKPVRHDQQVHLKALALINRKEQADK